LIREGKLALCAQKDRIYQRPDAGIGDNSLELAG
jgi:hypothetical protein